MEDGFTMRIRTEIKLPPRERKQIEAVAKELQWTITEVIRHCVRASLEWLLDKETNKKLQDLCTDLKQDDDRKNDKPIVENSQPMTDEELDAMFEELGLNNGSKEN